MTQAALAPRYQAEQQLATGGPFHREQGVDTRLRRRVLLWTLGEDAGGAAREALVALARESARLDNPAFLSVLDAVVESRRVVVALQAPPCADMSTLPGEGWGESGVGPEAVLSIARAIQDAGHRGMGVRSLSRSYLYACPEGVRIDPIGVLTLQGEPAGDPIRDLLGLLEDLSPYRGPRGEAELVAFVQRWRRDRDRTLAQFIEALEAIMPEAMVYPAVSRQEPEATLPLPGPVPAPSGPHMATSTRPDEARSGPGGRAVLAAAVVVCGAALLGLTAGTFLADRGLLPGGPPAVTDPGATPPAPTPVPSNVATLQLTAQEPTPVRVSVDGQTAFEGELNPGESRFWEGGRRVQVSTTRGKRLLVMVNGYELGPLSPAIGHPEWNEVDWGWQAGWKPPGG